MTIIRTQIMGSYYFFFGNFLLLNYIYIDTTAKIVATEERIDSIAKKICAVHEKSCTDNTKLRMLEKNRLEAVKAQNNLIKALEQGIFNAATKSRLDELDTLITQYDFDIQQEKDRQFSFLTVEQIKGYLREFVNPDTTDMAVRKLLINTFVREVILYDNAVTIIYNFIDNNIPTTVTKEYVENIEQQIESAGPSAVSFIPVRTIRRIFHH